MFRYKPLAENLLKLSVLLGFSLLFYNALTEESLTRIINPQFIGNIKLGLALLILLTAIQTLKAFDRRHNKACSCHHTVGQLSYMIFIGTLFLGLMIPASPLGSATAEQKGLKYIHAASAAPVSLPAVSPSQPAVIINDENHIRQVTALYENTPAFVGRELQIRGFVYHPDQIPANHFMVARFEISCCAADAIPSGLFVEWNEERSLKNDSWVEIQGKVDTFVYLGNKLPVIKANRVTPIKPLSSPYVYSNK
ncbi:TIGR03943 family protein [Sporomusa aerivorans]|uniref:TIGR03943 family putative permease subunit n=1 Tax=Sporomusa aerivorans TaxID=204936 RepID=UPI00352BA160